MLIKSSKCVKGEKEKAFWGKGRTEYAFMTESVDSEVSYVKRTSVECSKQERYRGINA